MRQWRGPGRVWKRTKMLTWLRAAPRTSRQIADLLGISRQHAATTLYQLRKMGRVTATDEHPMRYRAV